MDVKTFKAMVVQEEASGEFTRQIQDKSIEQLPAGEVLIEVHFSSLNYKDALSATGNKGVTRNYPHTPGIDAAGRVVASARDDVKPGEAVLVTGYDLGMNTSGGFGQYIRVPAEWVVRLPAGLSLKESMIYGTAGFTAALSVDGLQQRGVQPGQGEILVTGATGGVGSIAVAFLAHLGYKVVAVSGKPEARSFLEALGAAAVIGREEVLDTSPRPLLKSRWAGVVDTVGGDYLSSALKTTGLGGAVTCCGNVASPALNTTVFPFILRGISLVGIDSQNCPMPYRQALWHKMAGQWKITALQHLCTEIKLDRLNPQIDLILQGQQKGRVIVALRS